MQESILKGTKLYPISHTFNFIKGDFNLITYAYEMWKSKVIGFRTLEKSVIESNSLEETLLNLLPLTTADRLRYLFIPTNSDWVVYFDNGHIGTDSSAMNLCGMRLKLERIYFSQSPESGEVVFNVSQYNTLPNKFRDIWLIKESGWEFGQTGEPFPFELTEKYSLKKKRERITIEMIDSYLKELGIDVFNENFYAPEKGSILFDIKGEKFSSVQELSLEQAQNFFRKD